MTSSDHLALLAKIKNFLGYQNMDELPLERLLEETVYYYERIIRCMPGNVYWIDKHCKTIGCNQNVLDMFGLTSQSQFAGLSFEDMARIGRWTKAAGESFKQDTLAVIETGIPRLNIEEPPIPSAQGGVITFLTHRVPLLDQHANVVGVVGISIDITERKKMEEALQRSTIAAEAANRAKIEFIANMSHDIRTPLTGVVGMSQLLIDELVDPTHKQYAQWINESGEQLLALLNGILDVVSAAHLEEQGLREELFDLHGFLQDILRMERPSTYLKHIGLDLIMDDAVPQYIVGDRAKLHRILLNLLGNAIKFTEHGQVSLIVKLQALYADRVSLEFRVVDTGIGIPVALQLNVFDRFFRVSPSYRGQYVGHGVGLHIAQSYAKHLGGEIKLRSEEGVGTTFYFELSFKIGKGVEATEVDKREVASSVEPSMKEPPYLLLVEDNTIALSLIEHTAKQAGCRFLSAMDGASALTLVKKHTFDLIVTDIGLPDMASNELTCAIREWEFFHQKKSVPIVGLTAHALDKIKEECFVSGMNDVFSKPMSLSQMKAIVKQYATKTTSSGEIAPMSPALQEDMENELFDLSIYPLFDVEQGLNAVDNNVHLLYKMLHDLIQTSIHSDIPRIQTAYANHDWDTVVKLVHKIKGGLHYVGTVRMCYACQYMEHHYKAGQGAFLDRLYHQLMRVTEETAVAVLAWLTMYPELKVMS